MESLVMLKQAGAAHREAGAERDRLIVAARVDNWPWQKIADAAGMSVMGAQQAARRANGGELPKPRQHAK
jgi:hypothetical protein